MCFKSYDDKNVMQDHEASSFVNVLVGLEVPIHKANRILGALVAYILKMMIVKRLIGSTYQGFLIDWGHLDTMR
jgi:hypothetical protein